MAFEPVKKIKLGRIDDFYENLMTVVSGCLNCGWSLYDDQSDQSDKYVILKSDSSATTDYESDCYVGLKVFDNSHTWLRTYFFLGWDADTQTGYGERAWRHFDFNDTYEHDEVYCNSLRLTGTWHEFTLYGNKYFLNLRSRRVYDEETDALHIFKIQEVPFDYNFKTTSTVTEGNNVVLDLEDGAAEEFEVGDQTFILCKENHHFSKITVESVSTTSGTITVDNIFDTVEGSYIGTPSRVYPWCFILEYSGEDNGVDRSFNCYTYELVEDKYNNTDPSYTGYDNSITWFPNNDLVNESSNLGKRNIIDKPLFFNEVSDLEIIGKPYNMFVGPGGEGDMSFYNKQTIGQVVDSTSNTISDTSKNWSTDDLVDKCLVLTNGPGAGDIRTISSNDSDSITVYEDFSTSPTKETMYAVFDSAYVKCAAAGGKYKYLIRIA